MKKMNISILLITTVLLLTANAQAKNADPNLWKSVVAEAAGEGYPGMWAVACCVRNRYNAKMDSGLSSTHRRDLNNFVWRQGREIERQAKEIIFLVFYKGAMDASIDTTHGAIYFESTDFPKNIRSFDRKYKRVAKIGKHIFYVNK